MGVSQDFVKLVQESDLESIRERLHLYFIVEKGGGVFDEALDYVRTHRPEVIQKHDGSPFTEDESKWDKAYLSHLFFELEKNFSEERIAHMKKVLRSEKFKPAQKHETKQEKIPVSTQTVEKPKEINDKKDVGQSCNSSGLGLIIGGAAVLAVGTIGLPLLIKSKALAITVGAVSAGVGVGMGVAGMKSYFSNKNK